MTLLLINDKIGTLMNKFGFRLRKLNLSRFMTHQEVCARKGKEITYAND